MKERARIGSSRSSPRAGPFRWSSTSNSRAATVLLVLLFLANLALQLVFCVVVYWKLGASAGEEKKKGAPFSNCNRTDLPALGCLLTSQKRVQNN